MKIMKEKYFFVLSLVVIAICGYAKPDSQTYEKLKTKEYKISSVSELGVSVIFHNGASTINLEDWPSEMVEDLGEYKAKFETSKENKAKRIDLLKKIISDSYPVYVEKATTIDVISSDPVLISKKIALKSGKYIIIENNICFDNGSIDTQKLMDALKEEYQKQIEVLDKNQKLRDEYWAEYQSAMNEQPENVLYSNSSSNLIMANGYGNTGIMNSNRSSTAIETRFRSPRQKKRIAIAENMVKLSLEDHKKIASKLDQLLKSASNVNENIKYTMAQKQMTIQRLGLNKQKPE